MTSSTEESTEHRPDEVPVVDFDPSAHNSMDSSNSTWDALRTTSPVAWSDYDGGTWILSSYDAVCAAFRNTEALKSGREVSTRPGPGGDPELMAINAVPNKTTSKMIPEELDAPLWHPFRKVFASLLSPKSVKALQPRITHWVTKFLDDVIESGRCDIVETLTSGVPGAVVLEWLGFPEQDWHRLSASFHNMASYVEGAPESQHYLDELEWTFQRIREETAAVREEPRDDATSVFANTVIDDERVSFEFATGMVNMAMSGGVDTTTSVATAAFVHLCRHPEDRQRLIDEPGLIDSAIEEFLRVYPSARTHGRTATEDTEIEGFTIPKDDRVIISEVSACHDEAAFPDADQFVIDRFPNRHVAFGVGPHRCPGSHLARAMLKEMLTQVLERIPDYQIVEDELMEYPNWTVLGGWSQAPITFTPGTRRL